MTGRRALWSNGTVAHSSLKGQVAAERFTDGEDHRIIAAPAAALRASPAGKRDRELLWGQVFCVLDVTNGVAFGFARADGYTGYVDATMLHPLTAPATHRVTVRQTMALGVPDFKATTSDHVPLSLGSEVVVKNTTDRWTTIDGPEHDLFVPTRHLTPLNLLHRCRSTPAMAMTRLDTGGMSSRGWSCGVLCSRPRAMVTRRGFTRAR